MRCPSHEPACFLAASVAFYKRLGLRLIVDSAPRYVRFECPRGSATMSLHKVDEADTRGITIYFECRDLDSRVESLKAMGLRFLSEPEDQPWLWREARLRDPSGNEICLFHAGDNRRSPPWRLGDDERAIGEALVGPSR